MKVRNINKYAKSCQVQKRFTDFNLLIMHEKEELVVK